MTGALVTVEGVEGAGKTTQSARLTDALRRDGLDVVLTREPGGTELGRALRRMLLDETSAGPTAETELLLYLADRAEHVRRLIVPALERGAIVVADRFSDSTVAYQSYGRGLPIDTVRAIDDFARGGVAPTLTFVLDLPPEEGLARARAVGPADRLEREAIEFHRRVREGFHAIARSAGGRIVVLDAARPIDELAREIADATRARLGRR
ncbi:MAG TPA: dTMP kinase [Candidatus Binatia bacterium]|nr:dTMP kinase [Candidatus Binatia bacterium]